MPVSSCRSTIRLWSISGIGGFHSTATWPASENGRRSRSRRSTTLCRAFPKIAFAFTSAGAAGMARIMATCRLKDVVDLLIKVKAQAYSVEAGNVRHEHEWKVWKTARLPEGKLLIPGVVSHATNVLEHPELVADRIIRFAQIVGRENVVAGTDCGLGGRVHPEIAWAKLVMLAEGAKLATNQLWH